MYCSMCGKQLSDVASFCPYCGARLAVRQPAPDSRKATAAPAAAPAGAAVPPAAGAQPAYSPAARAPGSGQAYYAAEFERQRCGLRPSFNAAACFLGFWHTLYRGCWARFLALYSWLGVATAVAFAFWAHGFEYDWAMWWALRIWPQPGPAFVAVVLVLLAQVAVAAYNGLTFNRYLYQRCRGDARAVWQSTGALAAGASVCLVAAMLVLVLFAASVINGTRSAGRLSQTPYPQQGQEITDYCTLEMYLILSGTSVTPEKEAQYLNGACTSFPGTFLHSNEDMESVGENATLYCDSTVTLGQVLDAATDSHVWYFIEKNAAGGYDGNLCCFVGDSVIDFYVTVWFEGENALVQLSNPLLYLASSPSPYDDCYYATSQQGAAFLKWAYAYAAAS